MTGVVITVDDADVRARLGALQAAGGDLAPVLDDIGAQLAQHVLLRFEAGTGPGGTPWKPSARALAEGGQTLLDSGRLRDSITHRVGGDTVEIGSDVVYAAIHQFGGTIRAKTAKGLAFTLPWLKTKTDDGRRVVQSVTIPARPYLGFDDDDRAAVLGIVADHLARIAGGGAAA
jgi:phage virion morphogenesis protein